MAGLGHGVIALTGRKPLLLHPGTIPPPCRPLTTQPPAPGEILTLPADLRQNGLGLGPTRLAALATMPDLVVHCAGLTGFGLDDAAYRAVNIEGTARIVAFACRGRIPVLHVSTAYVCGEHDGPVPESPPTPGTRFANGYEASKAEAESLVAAAGRQGLQVAIARPSIVVGAWADGTIARFDNLYSLIRLVTRGRIRTLPATPAATLDLVPIDHVVHGLAHLAVHMHGAEHMHGAAGRIVHLVSGTPIPVTSLRDLALAYPQFHAPTFVPPATFDPAALTGAEQSWHGRVTELYATYLRRDPHFATDTLRALGGPACPPVDWPFLRRMIDRCVAEGFLRGPDAQRTSG